MTVQEIEKLQALVKMIDVASLDAPLLVNEDGSVISVGEFVADQTNYEDEVLLSINRTVLLKYLDKLGPRECLIIKYRYGFVDGEYHTLDYIANLYGVTRERIRQVEIKALNKLKQILHKDKIYKIDDLL